MKWIPKTKAKNSWMGKFFILFCLMFEENCFLFFFFSYDYCYSTIAMQSHGPSSHVPFKIYTQHFKYHKNPSNFWSRLSLFILFLLLFFLPSLYTTQYLFVFHFSSFSSLLWVLMMIIIAFSHTYWRALLLQTGLRASMKQSDIFSLIDGDGNLSRIARSWDML